MHYTAALIKQKNETELYRAYVAESLHLQGKGEYIDASYIDLLYPPEDFDVDEVIDDVIARAGLEVING